MIQIRIQKKLNAPSGNMTLDADLTIEKGQLIALYGASGAGKTSLLKILAGLLLPDKGKIVVDKKNWFQSHPKSKLLKPQERNIGFVFQDYALFPNMTILENLQFASGNPKDSHVDHLLELMELGDLQHSKPQTLSGGQQQRVALARALAQKPKILLLDEPLSALDDPMRQKLQHYLLKVHEEFHLTTILVSHRIEEIIKLSDWVIELKQGKIHRQGNPKTLFTPQHIKESFKVTAEVLAIVPKDNFVEATLLIQDHIMIMNFSVEEGKSLHPGDRVILASDDFNPKLYKG